ncbi:MAG: hypothetical protein KC620_12310 [Myxococcales bacterium]|nr:hypothetical protein [Myxococcales bacterium]
MRILATAALLALCCLPTGASAFDKVPDAMLTAFDQLARKADAAVKAEGPEAGMRIYEEAALNPRFTGYGRLHLNMARLCRELGRPAEAAWHFAECEKDERVYAVDREVICRRGFAEATAPLTITGLPDGGRAVILEPRQFAGPHTSGARLPKGEVEVVIEAPGRIARSTKLMLDGPLSWEAVLGLHARTGPIVPEGFVGESPDALAADEAFGGPPRWPAYVAGGTGLALVGAGLAVGLTNRSTLDEIRDRQRGGECGVDFCRGDLDSAQTRAQVADGLWIGGAVIAASALAWWLIFDEAPTMAPAGPSEEEAP